MSEPTRLAYDQLAPVVVALYRRERAVAAGAGFLPPPFPNCPTCGQRPTALHVNGDHPAHFLEDRIGFGFRPCGHNFTADGDDLYKAYDAARTEAP